LTLSSESERKIATRFGLTQAAARRHRINHLRPYLAQEIDKDPELAGLDPLLEIRALFYRIKQKLDMAEDADDLPGYISLHKEARRDLELLARVLGDVRDTFEQHNYVTHHHHPTREQQFEKLFRDIEEFRRENSS